MAIRIYIDQGHNPYGVNAGAEGFGPVSYTHLTLPTT